MTSSGGDPSHRDFDTGLADTISWYRENENWWRASKEATERRYEDQEFTR